MLLEPGFEVGWRGHLIFDRKICLGLDAPCEQAKHGFSSGDDATIEIDRTDERLDTIGQDRGLRSPSGELFSLAQTEVCSQVKVDRDVIERACPDKIGSGTRQPPLAPCGMPLEEPVSDHHAQNRVSKELKALVRLGPGVLGAPGTVREGALQQAGIIKFPAEFFTENVGVDQDPKCVWT